MVYVKMVNIEKRKDLGDEVRKIHNQVQSLKVAHFLKDYRI